MTKIVLQEMSISELVSYFEEICLVQSDAVFHAKSRIYNKYYDVVMAVRAELTARGERAALSGLYGRKDKQVRFQAAMATLIVMPAEARQVLQRMSDRDEYPHAANARSILQGLDDGSFVPT